MLHMSCDMPRPGIFLHGQRPYASSVPRVARKTTDPSPSADSALALHKSPAQLRLEALQQEHERLLREITKKRSTREVVERESRDAASALAAKVVPLRERYAATLSELQEIFKGLLGADSHLSKRDKARVRRLYARLLPDLAGDRDDDAREPEDPFDRDAPPWGQAPADDESEAGYSATKPSEKNAGLLRSLFRKLAVALHPDKVQDEKERATLTSVMKEVTRAYESGDVARLVEIERTWLAQAPVPERELDVARRITELLAANKELRRQLRSLTAELKELKQSAIGFSTPRRRGARANAARSEVDEMVAHFERELADLETVRDFAQRFADGEIGIGEFLLGPELEEGEHDPFEEMLAEVLEAMADAPRPRKAPRPRRPQKR
jgi:prefoldin subunit 5